MLDLCCSAARRVKLVDDTGNEIFTSLSGVYFYFFSQLMLKVLKPGLLDFN